MSIVSLESYTPFYYNILLAIVVFMWLSSFKYDLTSPANATFKNVLGNLLSLAIILYMGLRPISGAYFGDMKTYATEFGLYQNGSTLIFKSDIGFDYLISACAKIMDVNTFFLVCAFLYVFPLYLASKKWFGQFWFYSFLILVASFSFWPYGTNGLRNGLATSFTLLAFAYADKKIICAVLLLIATSFHKSMLLLVLTFVATLFYNNSVTYLYYWFACIPLSLIAGGAFETFFMTIGLGDDRLKAYSSLQADATVFSSTGFRWDFLLYSGLGTFAGWYFIFKKNFDDKAYKRLYNIYLLTNGFWILVIRANFSNRFAYLSWFMLGIIIVYPFLKVSIFEKQQHRILASIITVYFMFTYVLNVI